MKYLFLAIAIMDSVYFVLYLSGIFHPSAFGIGTALFIECLYFYKCFFEELNY